MRGSVGRSRISLKLPYIQIVCCTSAWLSLNDVSTLSRATVLPRFPNLPSLSFLVCGS